MQSKLRKRTPQSSWALTALEMASSTRLPLMDRVVDAVITSPPYCTRIDYVMASAPELAFLGFNKEQWRSLRNEMIGTLTVAPNCPDRDAKWGRTCLEFLDRVKSHKSRASDTYYLKTHLQYFSSMFTSLAEIQRVLRPGGHCVMVVQDSFYKEVRNDLATVFTEMGHSQNWSLRCRADFSKLATLARVNPRSQKYASSGSAQETVLAFQKAS
jgi:tRNA G10  N-methylase Trm11